MSDLYSNDKVRIKAEELVQREVIYCVSSLIGDLNSLIHEVNYKVQRELGFDEDDLRAISEIADYDEPADNCIRNNWDEFELREYLRDQDVEFVEVEEDDDGDPKDGTGTPTEELRILAIAAMEAQGAEDFCSLYNIDPDRIEVYEHWIVSSYLAYQLKERGHTVGEISGMTIWGRPTTGQAISMDSVILEIANDILKEYPE